MRVAAERVDGACARCRASTRCGSWKRTGVSAPAAQRPKDQAEPADAAQSASWRIGQRIP